jgi:TolB protein
MADLPPTLPPESDPEPVVERVEAPRSGRPVAAMAVLLVVVLAVTGLMGVGIVVFAGPGPSAAPSAGPPSARPPVTAAPASAAPVPPGAGLLAVIDGRGALTTVDGAGGAVVTYGLPGTAYTFPAWSPDGSHIAVVGQDPDGIEVDVFAVATTPGSSPAAPVAIYRSVKEPPFYVYWTPDGSHVGFLTQEASDIALRVAPADGGDTAALVRQAAPLYWDWADAAGAGLLVHGGDGPDGFLGELRPDGSAAPGAATAGPSDVLGSFRTPAASRDGRYRGYATSAHGGAAVVVETRDGSSRHDVPVFGPAALDFDPTGTTLGFIAQAASAPPPPDLPVGPLRAMDAASGSVRTLLDGSVIAFFWSPDGATVAALRVDPGDANGTAHAGTATTVAARFDARTAATPPGFGLHLFFIDAATGSVRSQRMVRISTTFVDQLLPYFDQYALSHRLWSADSSAVALPIVDPDAVDQVVVIHAAATDDQLVANGVAGFWRP